VRPDSRRFGAKPLRRTLAHWPPCRGDEDPLRRAPPADSRAAASGVDAAGVTLILQRSRFLHVPKTGGTWMKQALLAGCTVVEDFRLRGSDHTRLGETPRADRFTVAFVRHPLTWWQSFWRFHNGPARRYIVSHKVCSRCWSDDFDEFVTRLLDQFPGEYGRIVEYYLGPIGAGMQFIGRQEHLVDDLVAALRIAGEPHDERAIRAVAPAMVGDPSMRALYRPELAEQLLAAEHDVLERFGYGTAASDPAAAAAWFPEPAAAT
jgi:hypothetical protein